MTGTDLCVRLYKSVPVIFEPPCIKHGWLLNRPGDIWRKIRPYKTGVVTEPSRRHLT